MRFELPFDVEVSARASSSYTPEMIERRLAEIASRTDAEAERERAYLNELKARER